MRSAIGVALTAALAVAVPASAQRGVLVNIESTPSGAAVYLDAISAGVLGVTPLRGERLQAGSHALIFRLEGYRDARLSVQVARRNETFSAALSALATLVVTAANEAAAGAALRVDGQVAGTVPYRAVIEPGRHLVQAGREGHAVFTQWVELPGGQVTTVAVMLERERPRAGSILVASDVSGAPVFLDGEPHGVTPAVIENISAGVHLLEIRPEGREPHSQQVTVTAGERAVVSPTLRPTTAPTGTLRVATSAPGAIISLDGEALGASPVTRQGVSLGEHIIEATLGGYEPYQQTVTIEGGVTRALLLQLVRLPEVEDPIVEPAPMQEDPLVRVRVQEDVAGAQLYVDGEQRGPVPFEGTLPVGQHQIEVRARGYLAHAEVVHLVASSGPREISARLVREGPSEQDRAEAQEDTESQHLGAVTHAASTLPLDFPVVDISLGWPYAFELRAGVGLAQWAAAGLDAGIALRTFGRLSEFEGRVKLSLSGLRQLSGAVQARFGGGLGPVSTENHTTATTLCTLPADAGASCESEHRVNTWFLDLELLGTLNFSDRGAFTLWLGLDAYSDRYDYTSKDGSVLVDPGTASEVPRQEQARIRLGGALELVVSRNWNAWALLEGILVDPDMLGADDPGPRRVLGDILGFGIEDTELYFRLGLSYKF